MIFTRKRKDNDNPGQNLFERFIRIRRSIYGRVVTIISILSFFMFVSFGVIFKSVYEQYLNTVILQSGNNVGSLVEGALYYSMLENDKGALQSTMDVIHTLPDIEDVNMYDKENNLVYSSYSQDTIESLNPDCKSCHEDIATMFPAKEKAYRIITAKSGCLMSKSPKGQRHLMIRSPILNSRSCYTSSCHAHHEDEAVLGSLIIKVPLQNIDKAVNKSSGRFYLMAILATVLLAYFLILFTKKANKNTAERTDKSQCGCIGR